MQSRRLCGFSLVEVMIVVSVIGLLASLAVPSFVNARARSMTSSCVNNLRNVESAKVQYALDHTNQAPSDLSDLVGTNYYLKSTPACPAQGSYSLGDIDEQPSCSVGGTHVLQ